MPTRFLTVVVLFMVLGRSGLGVAAEAKPYLALELLCPEVELSSDDPVIIYRLHNKGDAPYVGKMPYDWYGLVWDWFDVFHDGKKLANPLSKLNYSFGKKTHLAPGESVTIAFKLSTIARLPATPKERLGRYVVKLRWAGALAAKPLVFYVVDAPPKKELGIQKITTEKDLSAALTLIGLHSLSPGDKLSLLKAAVGYGKSRAIWKLLGKCDDIYAIVEALKLLPTKFLEKDRLFTLLNSKDLAIRRAAITALGRTGKDKESADKLDKFLKTQKDEPTLKYGKAALKVLRGE